MTGDELKAVRRRAGLSVVEFGRKLGYDAPCSCARGLRCSACRNLSTKIRRYENLRRRPVPPPVETRAHAFLASDAARQAREARRATPAVERHIAPLPQRRPYVEEVEPGTAEFEEEWNLRERRR